MSEVYSYEQCQPVIKEAFKKAIDHLKETLGDQYSMYAIFTGTPCIKKYLHYSVHGLF